MGKIDVMTNEYMSDNERFADLFNYALYEGREVLRAEELEEMDPSEVMITADEESDGGRKKVSCTKKERDLLRSAVVRVADDVCYVLLGLENQSFVDYGLPVRKMGYESMRYDRQKKTKARSYELMKKRGEEVHMTSSEFLSGIRKGDKLRPVITLTLYFGQEEWDGPLSLHEMLDIKDRSLLPYIEDYKVNLILPKDIEDFSSFKTDLRLVLEMLKAANDKQKIKTLLESDAAFSAMGKDTAMMIKECTGVELEMEEREGKVNMCKGFADLLQDSRDEGRSEGFTAAVAGMVQKFFGKGMCPEEIAELTEIGVTEVKAILKQ